MFKRNQSLLDRGIRVVLAAILIYFGLFAKSFIGDELLSLVVAGFGVFNLIVAAFGSCPIYSLAGISTYRPKQSS